MGWDFTQGATRKDIIDETVNGFHEGDLKVTCLKSCTRGNVLWTVWQASRQDKETGLFAETERWIGCSLLQNGGSSGWGHKDMTETMGPCYYTVPPAYLALVPEPENGCGWRKKVAEHQAKAARVKGLGYGDVLTFDKPLQFSAGNEYDTFRLEDRQGRVFYAIKAGVPDFRCRLRSTTLNEQSFTVVSAGA